ncbi:MAG TPA: histidinol dehydrogenase [Thermoleophilia bacterium]
MRIRPLKPATVVAELAAVRPPAESSREIAEVVARLATDVQARGDVAVVEATRRFDWPEARVDTLAVPQVELEAAYAALDPELLRALELARDNCTFFHRHEIVPDWEDVGAQGQTLGIRRLPVDRAGLYVPGGHGSYASTVIMNSVPARVAGVDEAIVCTPPGADGQVNSSVLAAAHLMGIRKVFRVGGAQAIVAMAYGTEIIPRVDVICGPGNAYVTEAKRQVYGSVGIDSLAGPSEVLIVADSTARAAWVAADMLAQEEHGSGAQALLVADSERLCLEVADALEMLRAGVCAGAAGAPGVCERPGDCEPPGGAEHLYAFYTAPGEDFLTVAASAVNSYAPEHLEIHVADARGFLGRVKSAGAIFLGSRTPTAFGDYIAGSNHVLPTGGSARFSSPLSVDTFVRKSSYVEMTVEAVRALTPSLARVADSEGFAFHRVSAELRAAAVE